MIYVPGCGNASARLIICGEAPGKLEEEQGQPFVGPSGKMVDSFLIEAGIDPKSVYKTNVVKIRPPNNDIKLLNRLGKSIDDFTPQLWEEIDAIKPNAILAFGGTALEALTGMKGIEKYRGSILQSRRGYPKVISTIHPASLMHQAGEGKMSSWKDKTFIQWDVERAIKQSKFKELDLPRRHLRTCKSSLDLFRFLDSNAHKRYVSVDIETFRTIPICIGLAFSAQEAMSIPLFNFQSARNESGIGRSDMLMIWQALSQFLADPKYLKIGQNFKFDELQTESCVNMTVNFGMKIYGFFFDTMLGFRTLYPELKGKLEFIASVLTEEPYWKDEGKEFNPKKDKLERLLLYNAKDAAVTYEVFERELEELREEDLEDFFFTKIMPLHPFYSRLERRGIRRSKEAGKILDEKYKLRQEELESELLELTDGLVVNVNSNGPKGQVASLLFGVLKIPSRASTDEQTLDALMRNVVKDKKKLRILEIILEIRKVRKTRGTYINAEAHPDGRLRTGYRIMLETGRTSTSILKTPVTTGPMGLAFQTITKHGDVGSDLRSLFIPDDGYVFLEPDLSQAEARVVALLARDQRLIKLFKYGVDTHRVTASWIFDRSPEETLTKFYSEEDDTTCKVLAAEINKILKSRILEWERQLGKVFRHAGDLGMQKRTASEQAGISEWRAGRILAKFHKTNPGIEGTFQKEIVDALQNNNRILRAPSGRKRQFLNKWGEELFKEAYAFIPQCTVSDHLKFAAQRIEKRAPWIQMLQESHDSFLSQVPVEKVNETVPIIVEELERPIDFSLCSLPRGELVIPCEIKFSTKSWEQMEKLWP